MGLPTQQQQVLFEVSQPSQGNNFQGRVTNERRKAIHNHGGKKLEEDIKSEKTKLEELWFEKMLEQNNEA